MQLTNTTYKAYLFFICTIFFGAAFAQVNSPYSRYGLGDLTNTQHIINKAMGSTAVAYADAQIVNFCNPASYSNLKIVTYDLAVTIDASTLRSKTPVSKYNSTNFSPSYLSVGFPINKLKNIGGAFGFRPLSTINYSVIKSERLSTISSNDSIQTGYDGNGGLNQFYMGIGKKWKNGFSIGVNSGYNFGKKESNTKRAFINDSVVFIKSNYSTTTSFGGMFVAGGFQYETLLDTAKKLHNGMKEKYYLRLGATASFGQNMTASQNMVKQTFEYDNSGGVFVLDSIFTGSTNKGKIQIPATYTAGFMIQKTATDASGAYDIWNFGADFTTTKWSEYRFYNQADALVNAWQVKVGGSWVPNPKSYDNYFNRVNYRAGFNFGKDYINADGKELKTYGISFGLGLPVRSARFSYQYTTLHTAFEFGKRGSTVNNVTENYFKLSFALSISDIWFIKRKYD